MRDLPAIIKLEDVKWQIAQAVERIQDDRLVDPFIEAVP